MKLNLDHIGYEPISIEKKTIFPDPTVKNLT
jgi:hypothetical protein